MNDRRDQFLLELYRQMMNDIGRHILTVWQSVGVVVGAFALFALAEKGVMPIDLACSIVVLLCVWLYAHFLDANYWYNRNLVIVANIERQFLLKSDLRDIHYYFGKHRSKASVLTHLGIQRMLGISLALLVLAYHFLVRVAPGLCSPISNLDLIRCLPYVLVALAVFYLYKMTRTMEAKYAEFLQNSPGVEVDATGIQFGEGHPTDGPP